MRESFLKLFFADLLFRKKILNLQNWRKQEPQLIQKLQTKQEPQLIQKLQTKQKQSLLLIL